MNAKKTYPIIGTPGQASVELGKVVRAAWVEWANKQPDPVKASWLTPWDELDNGQQEVDILIGQAVAEHVRRFMPDLQGKQQIARLERQISDQSTIINALNRSVAQLMEHVRKYQEASKAVLDTYKNLCPTDLNSQPKTGTIEPFLDALVQLKQVASTKQAADMGQYEAVDFVRMADQYIALREAARKIYSAWVQGESLGEMIDSIKDTVEGLKGLLDNYPAPDFEPVRSISAQVQVTSVRITPHVRELIAMLEPDQEVEAVLYDQGKAVITQLSAKLAVLTQAVGDFLFNYPYQNTPGDPMHFFNKLRWTYDRIVYKMPPKHAAGDPVGYANSKLLILQLAASAVVQVWNVAPVEQDGKPARTSDLWNAINNLTALLNQLREDRTPTEGKDLQAKDTYCSK